jgi:indolepyruvate ferredoxin oxidoreductase beta subunit
MSYNILISGVGGQGVVLASYVLSQAALAEGYDVKQSEVHGMAQRGGCVTSHLRFGRKVHASLITAGTVDVLLSFESVEALRYVHWLRAGGMLVYNALRVNPSTVSSGQAAALPIRRETLEDVIRSSVPPKTVDLNLAAFRLGTAVNVCR